MPNMSLVPVYGVIQSIVTLPGQCCQQLVSVRTDDEINNFIISPDTYVINSIRLRAGMPVAAFYDANLPVITIYPAQYQAVIIGRRNPPEIIIADYFDEDLISSNGMLKLNLSHSTYITTSNGQIFSCGLENHFLIVYYNTSTRSIPAQTTPREVIVIC